MVKFGDKVTVKKTNWLDKKFQGRHGVIVSTGISGILNVAFRRGDPKSKWISKKYLTKGWK